MYQSNLALFERDNPEAVMRVDLADCSKMNFCDTYEGELNLIDTSKERPQYTHVQDGAILEAESWWSIQPLERDTYIVFGLGLGYYYKSLKKWLKKSSGNSVIFLDDDCRVIRRFLETEDAHEMLSDPQVIIKWIPTISNDESGWKVMAAAMYPLQKKLVMANIHVSCLQSYFLYRFDFFHKFASEILIHHAIALREIKIFLPCFTHFIKNFYSNIYLLGEAILGKRLFETFDAIPTLICGAGPSIEKQLPQIRELADRAVIVGSGSGVNVLTRHSIQPHFCGAIDPTAVQASRQLTSFAFDVPAFFEHTFFADALAHWHGPLIYMSLAKLHPSFDWFDEELGLRELEPTETGISTTNFLVETSGFLGCNPIVLAGVDLAYSEDKRYAEGVTAHQSEEQDHHEALDKKEEVVIPVRGLLTEEVLTTQVWVQEAISFADFFLKHPYKQFYNATEGGVPIPTIPNITLKEATDAFFRDPFDVEGWVHGTIQNVAKERISPQLLAKTIKKWKQSLENCLKNLIKRQETGDTGLRYPFLDEPAGRFFLQDISRVFDQLNAFRIRAAQMARTPALRARKIAEIERERIQYLIENVKLHLLYLEEGRKAAKVYFAAQVPTKEHRRTLHNSKSVKIAKPAADRHYSTYPSGVLKVEWFTKGGLLHGPWAFYSEEGTLLYLSHFVKGKREGESRAFYHDGTSYFVRKYKKGKLDGEAFTHYPTGILKTVLNYSQGELDGEVQLYFGNGKLKKELHFKRGVLAGAVFTAKRSVDNLN